MEEIGYFKSEYLRQIKNYDFDCVLNLYGFFSDILCFRSMSYELMAKLGGCE